MLLRGVGARDQLVEKNGIALGRGCIVAFEQGLEFWSRLHWRSFYLMAYAKVAFACGSMVHYIFCMFFFRPAGAKKEHTKAIIRVLA